MIKLSNILSLILSLLVYSIFNDFTKDYEANVKIIYMFVAFIFNLSSLLMSFKFLNKKFLNSLILLSGMFLLSLLREIYFILSPTYLIGFKVIMICIISLFIYRLNLKEE